MAFIIIIEDSKDIANLVELALKAEGHRIRQVEDGAAGLQALVDERPDLAIVDVNLPGMDGFELVRRARREHGLKDMAMMMLTALSEVDQRVKGLELADDYLSKPFSVKELVARVAAVLRRTQSRGLKGRLETMGGAMSAVQITAFTQAKGVLTMEGGFGLYMREGRIVHVTHPSLQGEAALTDILSLNEGAFRFEPGSAPAQESMDADAMSILLKVAKERDEASVQQLEAINVDAEGITIVPNVQLAMAFVKGMSDTTGFSVRELEDSKHGDTCLSFKGPNLQLVVLHSSLGDLPSDFKQKFAA